MGSTSDWDVMQHCVQTLEQLGIACERRALSAHRTPHLAIEWCSGAEARGLKVLFAAAGGAAHLAGIAAAVTPLPVLGVPMESASLKGLDSLLSMVQMPGGVPVATFAIGKPGAINAAFFAAAILALSDPKITGQETRATRFTAASPRRPSSSAPRGNRRGPSLFWDR